MIGITSFGAYVALGVEHILIGVDHIAFLLALLILCRRPREVVLMVTGFTLGHSITLTLAVLGVVEPHAPVIEALIGFTIALVAVENVGAGYDDFDEALAAWQTSSGHRANLLESDATQIGVGAARADDKYGTYWALILAAPDPERGAGG